MITPENLEKLAAAKSIRRVWVDSRVIRSIGHFSLPNGVLTVLEIEQRGRDYRTILQFYGAPQELAKELAEAESKAAVFFQKVQGVYPCQKVNIESSIFTSPEWRRGEDLPAGVKLKNHESQTMLWGWGPDSSPNSGEFHHHFVPDEDFAEDFQD